jgi:hypothetical protein
MVRSAVIAGVVCLAAATVTADEGMWLPEQLPDIGGRLEAAGLAIEPGRLADLDAAPMAAIASLGGCSASFVSPRGLVVTNHHCAYGSIQHNSTEDRNLLADGFLAASVADELPASPGSRVYVMLGVSDVTDRVLAAADAATDGAARWQAIERVEKELVAVCEAEPGRRCSVASFHGGLRYRLYERLEIRDVRLVYAPAGAIGKYGGDIDNWMWPRHTGDFAFYRAYVGTDGHPADPDPSNVPYQPSAWLQVGVDGVADGDYVMVPGFPGRTSRYRLSDEVVNAIEWSYPARIDILQDMLGIMSRETEGRPDAALAYAGWDSWMNNSLKNAQGMSAGFARSGSVERKRALEQDLESWIAADPDRTERWSGAVADLRALVAEQQVRQARDLELSYLRRSQLLAAARRAYRLARERELADVERSPGYQDRDLPRLNASQARSRRSFDAQVDRAMFEYMIGRYATLPADDRLPSLDGWFGVGEDGADPDRIAATIDDMYASTALVDHDARMALLEMDRAALEASDDPFVRLAVAMYDDDRRLELEEEALDGRMTEARPRFIAALLAHQEARGTAVYPDANGTLRVTFGNVTGYAPRDAVVYRPFTTAAGVAQKATGESPFDAPPELLEAIAARDYGPYAADGTLAVNFLSDVDTTGGNSGSATLDAKGRLVGLLFDGNWESLVSDWDFVPEVTRSIHVDVRYMLWVMDRIDGAWNLLEEMGVEPAYRPRD